MTDDISTSTPAARRSPLHKRHQALGASFTDFGGWLMPVRYTSELDEHHAVRNAAGLFDISHVSEFMITGLEGGIFLDAALAARHSTMPVGEAKYSLLLSYDGGIVDDVTVYRLAHDQFLIIANAGNREVVANQLQERAAAAAFAVHLDDVSESYALISVQGPRAAQILAQTPTLDIPSLNDLGYYASVKGHLGLHPILIARTGYTGEDGFELLIAAEEAEQVWDALLQTGIPHGLVPAGLASRDTLRLEAGMPRYGHELSLDVLPAQAGLDRVVARDKAEFVGRSGIASASPEATVLIGLITGGKRAGRAGYSVLNGNDVVGMVTSGALSPTLGVPIAMAYVPPQLSQPGTPLIIDVRGTHIPAIVTPLPFYRRTR